MATDYPAAHSMDTEWFAVDRDGRVGVFDSSENGAVPEGAPDVNLDELLGLLGRARAIAWPGVNAYWREAALLGLYYYAYEREPPLPVQLPYPLVHRPATPLHVDRLPPRFRDLISRVRFERVQFPNSPSLQPVEHVACRFWPGEGAAYLTADGVTVRPVPGREDGFAAFCEWFRGRCPAQAAELRFEHPRPNRGGGRPENGGD